MPDDAMVAHALGQLSARQATYKHLADYLAGRQNLAFSSDSFRAAFGSYLRAFSYNRCPAVVDAVADRLQIRNWETEGDQEDPVEAKAQEIWRRNRMMRRQGELHQEALAIGDAYLVVWPDPDTGEPVMAPNKAHCMTVVYDDDNPGRIVLALKTWRIDWGPDAGRWRLTIYARDVITRWISLGKSDEIIKTLNRFTPYEDELGPPEAANPYGRVPVFHIGNNADTGAFGRSELADVLPLQDGLNKSVADMLVTGEFHSFPQRWAVGVETTINEETGVEEQPFQPGRDRLWAVANELARFGQFDPSDIQQFIAAQDSWDVKIARVSRTPVYWLASTGTPPSGESRKTEEGPFVAKVVDRQVSYGSVEGDAMSFALEIAGFTPEIASGITPVWSPAESRSEQEFWTIAQLKASVGVPASQIFAEAGYKPKEIESFMAEINAKAVSAADNLGLAFGRGQTGG